MKTHVLLVSTFRALLRVELCGETFEIQNVRVVADREPIYFGLTSNGEEVFCVGRNLDLRQRRVEAGSGVNRIVSYRHADLLEGREEIARRGDFSLGEGLDLHQIRWRDGRIWVVTPCAPNLLIVDPTNGMVEKRVDLEAVVPEYLVHAPLAGRGQDIYHFNSIHFGERGQAFVLAHNWDRGAFALALESDDLGLVESWANLGAESHDVFDNGGELFVLNSQGNELVEARSDVRYSLRGSGYFPRGLAANTENFFTGFGQLQAVREKRIEGQSGLVVWSRSTRSVLRGVPLGNYGDVCDVLLLSEPDLTDRD